MEDQDCCDKPSVVDNDQIVTLIENDTGRRDISSISYKHCKAFGDTQILKKKENNTKFCFKSIKHPNTNELLTFDKLFEVHSVSRQWLCFV